MIHDFYSIFGLFGRFPTFRSGLAHYGSKPFIIIIIIIIMVKLISTATNELYELEMRGQYRSCYIHETEQML